MVKTLIRHGNSRAILIDKPILELLKITDQTVLDITTDGKSLIISPVTDDHSEKLSKALEKGNRLFGRALKNLADG
jgi:antitoxin component of MazEF toxin-antitoxin module